MRGKDIFDILAGEQFGKKLFAASTMWWREETLWWEEKPDQFNTWIKLKEWGSEFGTQRLYFRYILEKGRRDHLLLTPVIFFGPPNKFFYPQLIFVSELNLTDQ